MFGHCMGGGMSNDKSLHNVSGASVGCYGMQWGCKAYSDDTDGEEGFGVGVSICADGSVLTAAHLDEDEVPTKLIWFCSITNFIVK